MELVFGRFLRSERAGPGSFFSGRASFPGCCECLILNELSCRSACWFSCDQKLLK